MTISSRSKMMRGRVRRRLNAAVSGKSGCDVGRDTTVRPAIAARKQIQPPALGHADRLRAPQWTAGRRRFVPYPRTRRVRKSASESCSWLTSRALRRCHPRGSFRCWPTTMCTSPANPASAGYCGLTVKPAIWGVPRRMQNGGNSAAQDLTHARKNFRVDVTRAKL